MSLDTALLFTLRFRDHLCITMALLTRGFPEFVPPETDQVMSEAEELSF